MYETLGFRKADNKQDERKARPVGKDTVYRNKLIDIGCLLSC